jgi:multicomponent Na+:H+ antiporter subunit D
MKLLLVLPILIPLLTAALSFLAWRRVRLQRTFGVVGAGALALATLILLVRVQREGIQAVQIGNWPAPFGITLAADLFSAIMTAMAGIMGLTVAVYSLANIDARRTAFGYYPLLHILLMGVCGAFLTGDIFNLYVWFEVMLIASFVLLALGGERPQIEGALKYVTLNLMASALFLAAVGLLYGIMGTLNLADLAQKLAVGPETSLMTAVSLLFLVAFGIKAAMFPLFFWLPASYHTPPAAVSAIFAGLLTKVGVYALIRVFTLLFVQDVGFTHSLILILAGLTMVTGVLGAVAQFDFRRLLSFHIISQIGYLLMGLGLFTAPALAAAIFFMVHVILAKSALFLVSGIVERLEGSYDLKQLGGLYRSRPGLALLFLFPAFSLAGVPPFSGFFAKLALVQAGLGVGQYGIVAVGLAVSMLTLLSMMKIWAEVFWKPQPEAARVVQQPPGTMAWSLLGPLIVLSALTLAIGLAAEPLFGIAAQAANQLLDPAAYIQAVMGSGGGA